MGYTGEVADAHDDVRAAVGRLDVDRVCVIVDVVDGLCLVGGDCVRICWDEVWVAGSWGNVGAKTQARETPTETEGPMRTRSFFFLSLVAIPFLLTMWKKGFGVGWRCVSFCRPSSHTTFRGKASIRQK